MPIPLLFPVAVVPAALQPAATLAAATLAAATLAVSSCRWRLYRVWPVSALQQNSPALHTVCVIMQHGSMLSKPQLTHLHVYRFVDTAGMRTNSIGPCPVTRQPYSQPEYTFGGKVSTTAQIAA